MTSRWHFNNRHSVPKSTVLFGATLSLLSVTTALNLMTHPLTARAEPQKTDGNVDTSGITKNSFGDYVGPNTKNFGSNGMVTGIITHVKQINSSLYAYTDQSQALIIFNPDTTHQDYSQLSVQVADAGSSASDAYYTGHAQQIMVAGQQCIAVVLPNSALQTAYQHELDSGVGAQTYYSFQSSETSYPGGFAITKMQADANLSLPSVSTEANGQSASKAVIGKTVNIADTNGQTVTSFTLAANDIVVTNDNQNPGQYSYQLSNIGIVKVKTHLNSLSQSSSPGPYYTLGDPASTGNITLTPKAAVTGNVSIDYTDQDSGQVVSSKQLTGQAGQSATYQASTPISYELVDPNQTVITYTFPSQATTHITVTVKKSPITRATITQSVPVSVTPPVPITNVTETAPATIVPPISLPDLVPLKFPNRQMLANVVQSLSNTANIFYVDGQTHQTLSYEVLTGKLGDPIHFDTYQHIADLQQQGYYITHNGTASYQNTYFGEQPQVFEVVMQRAATRKSAQRSIEPSANQTTTIRRKPKLEHTKLTTSRETHQRDTCCNADYRKDAGLAFDNPLPLEPLV